MLFGRRPFEKNRTLDFSMTPNFIVYGESGRYPLEIDIKVRMISCWCKLIQGKQSKLSTIAYKLFKIC
jgi:hypothetical protein